MPHCRGRGTGKGRPQSVGQSSTALSRAKRAFRYSEALQEFGGKWELERLDEYLSDPAGTVPGTRMNVPGVTDDTDRADLIAYLNQNSANPLPIGLDPKLEEAEARGRELTTPLASSCPIGYSAKSKARA